jgi:hypothetical protein
MLLLDHAQFVFGYADLRRAECSQGFFLQERMAGPKVWWNEPDSWEDQAYQQSRSQQHFFLQDNSDSGDFFFLPSWIGFVFLSLILGRSARFSPFPFRASP